MNSAPPGGLALHRIGFLLLVSAVALSCNDLTESVSTDVCASGRRWAGANTGDEEMYPGRDCLACHLSYDGPELMAAGTVYGLENNLSQIENDCFGLEGVEVELEGADGHLFTTTTNRAGNFYFDGSPSLLAKPYVARLRYTNADGRLINPQMIATAPSYGGCARCHDFSAAVSQDVSERDPEFVRPVDGLFVR